ncbi:extensin family protein [Novosphingobium flavum]|uniref:extensin family protein n=1 Tax=Novosphingobium flavum TaxID=1778672 RepID=UPI0031B5F856
MRFALPLLPLLGLIAGCGAVPQAAQKQPLQRSTQAFSPRPEARACLADLGKSKAAFTPLPDQYFGASCSALNAVKLTSLGGDGTSLAVSNLGPVTCPLAQTFAAWARFGVDRAARQIMGAGLARIETMGSYNCRTVAGSDRMSAHSTASAIDVAAFVLTDGRRITVRGDWSGGDNQARAFLQTVHESACKRFGTTLGPGYNAAHKDHSISSLATGGRSAGEGRDTNCNAGGSGPSWPHYQTPLCLSLSEATRQGSPHSPGLARHLRDLRPVQRPSAQFRGQRVAFDRLRLSGANSKPAAPNSRTYTPAASETPT